MMREIKFRIWDKQNKEMLEWLYPVRCWLRWLNGEDKEVEVMQFTGLFDKNGKEIYEEDLLRIIDDAKLDDGRIDRVEFKNGCYVLPNIDINGLEIWELTNQEWNRGHKNCEVIGNVYENPELLKVKDIKY